MVYGLNNGEREKVRGLKKTNSLTLTTNIAGAGDCVETCVFSAFGYGAEGKRWAKPHTLPFSPTHPYGRKEQRPHKTQGEKTGR